MNRSENVASIAAALAKAQKALKPAVKDVTNSFFKSAYADLEAVTCACRDALADNDISYSQMTDFDERSTWVETLLMHKSGEWLSGRYPLKPVKDDPQGMGSAVTYSKRYALMGAVGVVATAEDDDGNAASGHANGKHPIEAQAAQAAASNPKADPGAAAKKWAVDAEKTVRAFTDQKALAGWQDANKNALVKLHGIDTKAHEKVMEAIEAAYDRTNPLAA